jgi:hypothetical protein
MDFIFRNMGLSRDQQVLITRAAWVLFVTFHILWVCGWLSILGLAPPFAVAADAAKQAADFKEITVQLKEDRLERLEHDILTIKTSYCKATNEDAKRQYAQRVQELIDRYYKIDHNNPRVPNCDEV